MHAFLTNNRDELIERCKLKVAQRPKRAATEKQLANGIPLFIDQLTRTLEAEEANEGAESIRISGPPGGDSLALSEIGVSAKTHGGELLQLGYSVDQVVHDYWPTGTRCAHCVPPQSRPGQAPLERHWR